MKKTINWGILGTGTIANTFAADINLVPDHTVRAVASRNIGKAEAFRAKHKGIKAYGSYEALAADEEVDIIYIATPHVFHKEHSILCMRQGKSVLCEKPMAINSHEMTEMINVAKENNVFLMEAMWTRFRPTIAKLRQLISDNAIGEIRYLKSDFGFMLEDDYDQNARLLNKTLGGGALLDVGVYPIAMAHMVIGPKPVEVVSTKRMGPTDVDLQVMAGLAYDTGKSAMIHAAINTQTRWETYIAGTKGSITIPNTWFGNTLILNKDNHEEVFTYDHFGSDYTHEIEAVGEALRNGLKEHPLMTHQDSLDIMAVVDTINKR